MSTMGITMLDDFLFRALLGGVGIAIIAGPLGCFVVWRKMSYFGDMLAHSALLGVALGLVLNWHPTLAVFLVCLLLSLTLVVLQQSSSGKLLASDSLLGILSHASLAFGLLVLSMLTWLQVDLNGILFGDLLAISKTDLAIIGLGALFVLIILGKIWNSLFSATLSLEISQSEGMNPKSANLIFMVLLAVTIAIAMKIIGALLMTALLIIPAATGRRFASTPEQMALFAALIGAISVGTGLFASLHLDTPSGPSIVAAATALFVLTASGSGIVAKLSVKRKIGQ